MKSILFFNVKIRKIIYFLIFSIINLACSQFKDKSDTQGNIKALIIEWEGKKIVLPNNLETKVQGKDTICTKFWNLPFRILIPIDLSECTECSLRLYEWKNWLDSVNNISNHQLMPLMIVYQKNYRLLEHYSKRDNYTYPIFYDRKREVITINKLLADTRYNVFLLDSTNNDIVIKLRYCL